MKLTASKLRQDIYKILDEIIKTGKPVEIERNGSVLRILPVKTNFSKMSRLKKHKITDEESENFTHIDWSSEWKAG